MQDLNGTELKVGDYIIYSTASGHSSSMTQGIVIPNGKNNKFRVIGYHLGWSCNFDSSHLMKKPSYLQLSYKILKINKSCILPKVKESLDKALKEY